MQCLDGDVSSDSKTGRFADEKLSEYMTECLHYRQEDSARSRRAEWRERERMGRNLKRTKLQTTTFKTLTVGMYDIYDTWIQASIPSDMRHVALKHL
eukprot:831121-Amorphochlora_amoeboformis.AAC.1